MTICADIAPFFPGIAFPVAVVPVLAGERTFWEKATLIHAACVRESIKDNPQRLARHWYDLAMFWRGRKSSNQRSMPEASQPPAVA